MGPRGERDPVEGDWPEFGRGNRHLLEDARPLEEVHREAADCESHGDGDEGEIDVRAPDLLVANEFVDEPAGARSQRRRGQPRSTRVGKAHHDDDLAELSGVHPRDAKRPDEQPDQGQPQGDHVRDQRDLPRVQRLANLAGKPGDVGVDAQALVEEKEPDRGGDGADGDGRTLCEGEQYREREQRNAQRDEDGLAELFVGEKLLQQVVRGLDVTGLPDDDPVDGVDGHPALDYRDEPFVLRAVDDDDRRVDGVVGDQRLDLSRNLAVGRDGVVRSRDGGHDRVIDVGGDPQRLQQAVDPAILRVVDTDSRDQCLDGVPSHHWRVGAKRFAPVQADDQRTHVWKVTAGE